MRDTADTKVSDLLGSGRASLYAAMAGKVKGVTVRPAKPEDFDGVMAIVPDLFGGADYMPNKYHSYFSDPKAHPYVGEVDGEVVSFSNYYVEDRGHTVVSTGGRTVTRFQGTGLNNQVGRASLAAALRHYPQLRTEARVAVDDEFYEQYRKPDPARFHIVTEQYFLQYLTTKGKILNLLDHLQKNTADVTNTIFMDSQTAGTSLPDSQTANSTLSDSQTAGTSLPDALLQSDLFPDPSFITPCSYHPLHVTRDNLTLVCSTTDVVATMGDNRGTCSGVSFSLCTQFKIGPSLTTFYHVTTLQDMLLHLRLQLERKRREFSTDGKAILELAFPLGVSVDETKEALFPFLGKNDIYDSTPRETILVMERPLKKEQAKL